MLGYPGTTWEYWAQQEHAVINEALRQLEQLREKGKR